MREKNSSKKYKYINSPLSGFLLLFLFMGLVYARPERWVYRYNGPGNGKDIANAVVYGNDGNIYAAGYSTGNGTTEDFTVVSLTTEGDTNWIYRYNGPGNDEDIAKAVVYGNDGNIYAAGYSTGNGTGNDFTVVSLTSSGDENWIYRYVGYGVGRDIANSIVFGADFKIYVGGMAVGSDDTTGTRYLTVISLTISGYVNWVYRYDDPEKSSGGTATSIVYGADDNIYAAGALDIRGLTTVLGVVSINSAGDTNWTYRCGPEPGLLGVVHSIVYGADENIYVAAHTGIWWDEDFTVISVDTTGTENWVHIYEGPQPGEYREAANSIVYGTDGNIYVAGTSQNGFAGSDFTVISFTTNGDTNWVYLYNGFDNYEDVANSIVYGLDGNIYAGGFSRGSASGYDFTAISLTTEGDTNWVYRYNGPEEGNDAANSIVYGVDNNIYVAGYSTGNDAAEDFTVISLDSVLGIEEIQIAKHKTISLEAFPNPFSNRTAIRFQMIYNSNVEIGIYDVTGRLMKRFNHLTHSPCNQLIWNGTDDNGNHLPAGVYFVRWQSVTMTQTIPIILIR